MKPEKVHDLRKGERGAQTRVEAVKPKRLEPIQFDSGHATTTVDRETQQMNNKVTHTSLNGL